MPDRIVVADASAIAAIVFGEPEAEEVSGRLRACVIAAPTLLPYEVESVCLKKLARYPARREQILAALVLSERMKITQVVVPPREAVRVAREAKLTVYDAAYLWLARSLKAELITLDEKLGKAARRTTRSG